ncbi:carboxylesterase [Plantactinospora sp. BC1]|uniref:carboxylesterase/lipase family protein n=1 Tax=Plantactinospora sp. BC1 TaxID=2108470 RepID=UPI000D17B54B|nr:carboxylesterase family protein [Plantactinospora sp. BC1]AVT33707.1 carboxylesterase [Plantactinospora sp. BC1]
MDCSPQARIATGVLEGEWKNGIAAFLGIPFAAAPVGANRFAAPRPAPPWDGVRRATEFGSAPPQPRRESEDDDWLNLAVWTPDPGARGLPVLVWISGGAYLQCSTANPHHDGRILAAGGAVVVSVNYRVGAEGWAHLPGYPDNRGLLDQIAALRWVRENIAAFGGAPDNVAVFGQSSGAGSVAALLVMPRAAGLFDRAIVQSLPGTYFTSELAAEVTGRILAELDPSLAPEQLAEVSPQRLTTAVTQMSEELLPTMAARWGPVAYTPTPFSPVVDGEILPVTPWEGLAAGPANQVPMLLGHVRDEGRLLAARLGPAEDAAVDQMINSLAPAADAARYRADFPELAAAELREVALGDWLMRMPTLKLAEAAHRGRVPVWLSELCWGHGPGGAAHTLDALLVFGTADIFGEVTTAGSAKVEEYRRLSELMRTEYLTFAATGDPGWSRFDPDRRATRIYGTDPSVRPYPEQRSQAIWSGHRYPAMDRLTTVAG